MPHFPKSYDVGYNCELVLWMTKFKGKEEKSSDIEHWNLRRLYTAPLLTQGMQEGVLDMLEDRLSQAHQAKNSRNNWYITMAKRDSAKAAIAAFRQRATDDMKRMSMTDIYLSGHWCPGNPPAGALGALMQGLFDSDVYFPPNHPGALANVTALLDPSAGTVLWDFPFPDPDTLEKRTLGDMTFEKVFLSDLRYLNRYFNGTFTKIQAAKDHGVFRPASDKQMDGEPDNNFTRQELKALGHDVKVGPNGKCCINGVCQPVPNKYCQSTTGQPNDPCNSMSDWCPPSNARDRKK